MQQNAVSNTLRNSLNQTRRNIRTRKLTLRQSASLITLLVILAAWQLVVLLRVYPSFIIPAPFEVAERFYQVIVDGRLWFHTSSTLVEVAVGLSVGVGVGLALGYAIAKSPFLDSLLSPVIVAFQSTPVVAYAPLLVIWFGSGVTSKILTSALIVFFPMLMNTAVGIRNVPANLRDVMRVSRATSWQMFTKLEVPAAMPVLITGLKTSATLAVIGAVVGEFIAPTSGLGSWINQARGSYDTPLVLVIVLTLAIMARLLYGLVTLLEWRLLAWQRRSRRQEL